MAHLFTEEHLGWNFHPRFEYSQECLIRVNPEGFGSVEYAFLTRHGTDAAVWHLVCGYLVMCKDGTLELDDASQEVFPSYKMAQDHIFRKLYPQGYRNVDEEQFHMAALEFTARYKNT